MATSRATVDFVLEQLEPLDTRARAMFGEYGVYVDGKMIILLCDETVFIKPSDATAGFDDGLPYPGAKPHPIVPADVLEDAEAFKALAQATAAITPAPRPKKASPKKPGA